MFFQPGRDDPTRPVQEYKLLYANFFEIKKGDTYKYGRIICDDCDANERATAYRTSSWFDAFGRVLCQECFAKRVQEYSLDPSREPTVAPDAQAVEPVVIRSQWREWIDKATVNELQGLLAYIEQVIAYKTDPQTLGGDG